LFKVETDDIIFSKSANNNNNNNNNRVSIIIPTNNSAKTLYRCLESVRRQIYKNIEIIVVDSYSLDSTLDIASKFDAKVYLTAGERAAAKNFGISKSSGEFLLFVDSDMILQPAVVSECISICSCDRKVAGIIVPERSIGTSFWVRVRDFERSLYMGSKIESARFFRKSFVVQVGGFDEDIIFYEESTLHQKLEKQGLIVNKRSVSLIIHNEEEFGLTKWLEKKHYYSTNAVLYSNRYPNYAEIQTKIQHRIRIFTSNSNWKRLIRHPLLTLGLLLLKSMEFFASQI
jgi:glycosyltransferase involved in cell wall biosynthesis